MTKPKKYLLCELFSFAGNYKYLTICGMLLSSISAILLLIPILYLWLGVKEVFNIYPAIEMTDSIIYYVYMAFLFSIASILIYFVALLCTHFAAFRIAKNMRKITMQHIMRLPIGFFKNTGSGKLFRIIDDSATTTEAYLAHQLPDIVGALTTPIVVMVVIFFVDWQLGLASLISLFLATTAQIYMTGKGYDDCITTYQSSLDNMNNKTVEFVRGISVIKSFGQSIFSFKRFYKFIEDFKNTAINYTKFYRTPMCLYQTFLASTPIFLCFCGVFLFLNTTSPQELLLNFLFYVFLPQFIV